MIADRQTFGVRRIGRIVLTVADLDTSCDFYHGALGFSPLSKTAHSAILHLNGRQVELVVAAPDARAYPDTRAANDPWFQHFAIRVEDISSAYEKLARYPHQPISIGGPQRLPPSTGSVTAYKFRDPDGHPLELSYVPAQGLARQDATPVVDHTALVVRDLDASLAFYTDELGFSLGQRFRNRGPEQDRLDGLTEVDLDIVILTTPEPGPHIELLHYRNPPGQARGASVKTGDVAATRTILEVAPPGKEMTKSEETAAALLRGGRNNPVQDPDGHRFEFGRADGP